MALPPPLVIATPSQLAELTRALASEPAIAVDTESNSLHAYREQVCLIQFSTPACDYIVDPLALPDVSLLAPLFANAAHQKVFHAAEYDLLCLHRDYGFEVNNLFDTMVSARTLGYPQIGLAALLEKHFAVKTNKKHQRADWGHRPLTHEQLDYARLDTHFLLALRDVLEPELTAVQRLPEAREEFERLSRLRYTAPFADPDDFWRVNGARDLTPAQASLLRELYHYRDRQAERANRPPFKIFSEQTLIEIARRAPRAPDELLGIAGMTPGQLQRHALGLLKAVHRGLAAPPSHPPRPTREPDDVRDRYDRLHQWRKRMAQARGVESDVILPREALWEMARRAPHTADELETLEHLGPWRRETYGSEILKVLNE